jgi:predicted PurR-regulated permease PerM
MSLKYVDTVTERSVDRTTDDRPSSGGSVSVAPLAMLVVVGVAALAVAVFVARVQQAIGLTFAAVCLSLITLPLQRKLQRWIGSVGSLVTTALGTLAVVVTIAYVVLRDLGTQAEVVAERVRERLDTVRPGSFADRVVNALQLDSAIDEWLHRVPSLVVVGSNGGTEVGRQLLSLFAVVILATFFQSSGRSIIDWFVARWPRDIVPPASDPNQPEAAPSPRARARAFLHDVERNGVGYMRRSFALGAATSVLVWAICELCGLPGSVAVGLWAGVWFVVPAFGWAIGLMPLGLLLAIDPNLSAWIAIAAAAAVAVLAAFVRRRFIERETLRIGVAAYVLSVGLGIAIAGVGGSFVTVVLGAMLCAALTSSNWPGRPPGWSVDPKHTRVIGGVTVPIGWRGALVAMAMLGSGVLLWAFLHRLGAAIVWLLIGGFVAIALSRPIALLERRTRLTRQWSAALLLGMIGCILVLVTIAGVEDGARATTAVTERLPQLVADLEETRVIGPVLRDRHASVWVQEQMNDLPQNLDRARPEEWLPTVGARLVDLFWTGLFAMALLIDGPRLYDASKTKVPARQRRQYMRISAATGAALAGYAAGAALIASINASVVFTIAIVLGVGMAPVLAVWAFVWNFVPQIGGFMGGVPLILFALVAGPLRGLVAGLLYVTYQFIENHLIQPAIIGAAIDVPPWGTLIAALVGGAAAGVVGAVVITPLVGVVRVIRQELSRDDFPGATVRTEVATVQSAEERERMPVAADARN